MRYKWIELQNYIGIYNGMGLTTIKIDFTKCITNKILIRGDNGSGKSTLMCAINPNPDSNDNFIPNAEARKNICLIDNGIEYIIRYIHPVTNSGRATTKGYISKSIDGNMVELNPNGNISSCKDILYAEFNLDSNYLSLSQLSTENRGLVDSKPAERKRLINSIIHTMDTYNGIYKTLTKKVATLKTLVSSLTYKIDSIGNEVAINASLGNIRSRLDALEQERQQTTEAIAATKVRIADNVQILRDNNYDSVCADIKSTASVINYNSNIVAKSINDLGIQDQSKVEEFLEYINREIATLEAKIVADKDLLQSTLSQREVEFKDLQNKQERLNGLQSEYNYTDIKTSLEQAKKIVTEYDAVFKQMGLMNISLITKSEFDSAMESLMFLKERAGILTSSYHVSKINYVVCNMDSVSRSIADLPTKKRYLDELSSKVTELQAQVSIYEAKRQIASELVNRPSGCTIDNCPYIESALKAEVEYPESTLINLQSSIEAFKEKIAIARMDIEEVEEQQEIYLAINELQRELKSKMRFIQKLPVRADFMESFFDRVVSLDSFDDISNLYAYIDCGNMIEEYKVASEQLKTYELEYKLYQSKNDIIESVMRDVENLMKKTDDLAVAIEGIHNRINVNSNTLEQLNGSRSKVEILIKTINEILIPAQTKLKELNDIKGKIDGNTSELSFLQEQLGSLNGNLSSVNADIKKLSGERERLEHQLVLLADYKAELAVYTNNFNKIDKIRYYSSSSTGIQTVFMQLYMNRIIIIANELLSLLFDGEFSLQRFIINDSEFRIPCVGNGLAHDDISSMSLSQKCMISTILSFSILHQSATRYNILFLDEIDGGLDTINRSMFINLLDRLMNMLKCEQCFIVSHNDELSTEMCDLIILKNNARKDHKGNVIWRY